MSFIITGHIRELESGVGVPNLRIEAWDKDLIFDDKLGACLTDTDGSFKLSYTEDDFQDLFEKRPDIYLKVFTPNGIQLHSTEKHVRCESGKEEHFNINLPRKLLGEFAPKQPDKEESKMADSILSITIRDTRHPCAPYQNTTHSFRVQIFNCDGKPLFWKGVNYGKPVLLQERGERGGLIHGQFKVPPGCYLIRGSARCNNVITDWASVTVCCNETVCVDLVIPDLFHCILRTIDGLKLGTVGERPVIEIIPKAVEAALEALQVVADNLPKGLNLPAPPAAEDIEEEDREQEKKC